MRVPPPELLPLLRSAVQGKVLATTYLSPEREFSVSQLARLASATPKATAQEVDRLVTAGFLDDRRSGNQRLIRRPNPNRIITPLTELLAATYGPLPVLAEELRDVTGVEQAFIYGSWAARESGVPGGPPDDVDVLVVGTPSLDDLDDLAERATKRLHRAVNVRRVPSDYWATPPAADTFIASVKDQPLVAIPLDAGARA